MGGPLEALRLQLDAATSLSPCERVAEGARLASACVKAARTASRQISRGPTTTATPMASLVAASSVKRPASSVERPTTPQRSSNAPGCPQGTTHARQPRASVSADRHGDFAVAKDAWQRLLTDKTVVSPCYVAFVQERTLFDMPQSSNGCAGSRCRTSTAPNLEEWRQTPYYSDRGVDGAATHRGNPRRRDGAALPAPRPRCNLR